MRVVRHGAQGEHAHVLLKRLAAVDGEEDQIILDGVEDNASVTCSLDDVMDFAGVDFALFHVFFVRKDRICLSQKRIYCITCCVLAVFLRVLARFFIF
jgi:hypothetical protein